MIEELNTDVKKLRFLDGDSKEYPGWEEKLLGETKITFTTGKRDANEASVDGEYNFYTCSSTVSKISQYSFEGPSLLIAGNGVIGDVKYYDNKFDAYQRVYVLQNLNEFEHNYLKTTVKDNLEKTIRSEQMGSTLKYIRLSTLTELKIFIPSLPEQTKIADFLSKIDERIEAQSELVELLKEQKQGYSQRLFNGSLRFKKDDGTDYEDWGEKKLGEIGEFYRGNGLPKSDMNENGKYDCVHYGELFSSPTVFSPVNKTNYDGAKFNMGTILMPSSDVTADGLAKASVIQKDNVVVGGDTNVIIVNKENNPVFVALMIRFQSNKIIREVVGTTVKHIYPKNLRSIFYYFPSLPEQEKIAEFLSSLDNRIDEQLNKLEQLKLEKQAYMQRVLV